MNYLSVCSGIEAASCAWHDFGWKPVGFSEIEKFPSQVLAHHYPHVPNFGDMTKYKDWNINESVDLLVGGTPCQSFSVAGLRKGLEDPRGNLALTYVGILDKFRPQWFIWENVPGVLSSGNGRDFGAFLGAVAELGYGFAYRVLDAQNFGVAQRRRRVFVVGHLGDWRPAAEILFESESLLGDTKKSRKTREEITKDFVPSIANTLQTTCHEWSRLDGFNMIAKTVGVGAFGKTISDTVTAKFSKGAELLQQGAINGGNCVLQPIMFKVRSGKEGGGKGYLESEKAFTISTVQDQNLAIFCNDTFPCLTSSAAGVSRSGNPVTEHETYITYALNGLSVTNQNVAIALAENTIGRKPENGGNGDGFTEGGPMYTLNCTDVHGVAVDTYNGTIQGDVACTMTADMAGPTHTGPKVMVSVAAACIGGQHPNAAITEEISPTLTNAMGSGGGHIPIIGNMAVRRLTPVECERLQGFSDNYTNVPKAADGPRYKALGNSMAVPVMRWIGQRIKNYEDSK